MRIAFAFCLAVTLLAPIASIGADRKESMRRRELYETGGNPVLGYTSSPD